MKKFLTLFYTLVVLSCVAAHAETKTWTFEWNTSKGSGGQGFYHMTNDDATSQNEELNGITWNYTSNVSVVAFTASTGQVLGSAKSPIIHSVLSTEGFDGKIKSVALSAKTKGTVGQVVTVSVKVNDKVYGSVADLTSAKSDYKFVSTVGAEGKGKLEIIFDQESEVKDAVYIYSMTVEYETGNVETERKNPSLDFAVKEVALEAYGIANANPLTNPSNLSPITYKSSDTKIAVTDKNGNVYSTGVVGETEISAIFEGNDEYLPQTVSYKVNIVAPVLLAPTVDVAEGKYSEPITVTIKCNSETCDAIWYSVTAADSLGLVNDHIMVFGNEAQVTLDKSSKLICCGVAGNEYVGNILVRNYEISIPLVADFTSEDSKLVYYNMGWDDVETANTWEYYVTNGDYSWALSSAPANNGAQPFTVIDPQSKNSLIIRYCKNKEQKERAVSPVIEVKPNSEVEFYTYFSAIMMYGSDCKLYVYDTEDNNRKDEVFSAYSWAQENGFNGPNWLKFNIALDKYAGHKCKFEFCYTGMDGEDFAVDGFKINQLDNDPDAKINVYVGQKVRFDGNATGNPDSYEWTFEGADVTSSNETNPVVTYSKPGEYTVSLIVRRGEEQSIMTKEKVVIVRDQAPKALIASIEGGYLSPLCYVYVPVNVPVKFTNASTGFPTEYKWTLPGTDVKESNEASPIVKYVESGTYGVELEVGNSVGKDKDILLKNSIKAGGATDVWNISPEEIDLWGVLNMSFYGYYGGTNALGIETYAEHFDQPLVPATVDEVGVYFASVSSSKPDALVTVSLCLPDANGMPGEPVASKSVKISELKCDDKNVLDTRFKFDKPVSVNSEFFVTVTGFQTLDDSQITMFAVKRTSGSKATTYTLLEDEDDNYQRLGTYSWRKNEETVSFALVAHLSYDDFATSVSAPKTVSDVKAVYTINGTKVENMDRAGIYIVKEGNNVRKISVK